MHKTLIQIFYSAFISAFPQLKEKSVEIDIAQSKQEKFGHYQCNTAMRLTKQLHMPPREIAQRIVESVDKGDAIEKLEIAGPGFINIFLSPAYIEKKVQTMAASPRLDIALPEKTEKVIVEFSSPNTAKELHVGHLRSTIIGDCLARVFEFLGHDVLRLNHVGDWGTAFGMLIAYLKLSHPEILTGEEETDLPHLVSWYKASKKQFDEDPGFKKISQLEVVSLQGGESDSLKAWEIICEISRRSYQEIYNLLDVAIEERGESYYNPVLPELIEELDQKELIEISEGAKCIFIPEFCNREGSPMPLMVQKSDGGFGYDTTDMAAMKQRVQEEKADRIIIVTDAGQALHFKLVYAASVKAGYLDPDKVRFDHVTFGLVLGADGKKFRTRSGEVERLIDLIYTAIDKAREIMAERNPDMPQEQREKIARALGIGAIKYADLSCHRTGDYTFSYDRMLRFEGNTAAFLMYAYVRIAGIKRKIGADIDALQAAISLKHPSEMALGLHLAQFNEALQQVAEDLLPNRLSDYLYTLAEKFNAFYRDCQVEGAPEQNSRLLLCEATARILKQGLHLLGVETVEKM
ncbi:Arginyl-tRNA synthetase [Waddlia chondrophila 2032/99]|uniref:Arginine--tRNA ligase n=2 Tax=Waddlia chondrophila TaxID=71667 RepID=D6YSK7_WADCW|nr:arginine--tRNA ligase [Waddlia chondrophila]ADI39052.1 Arginyl-tRNA synthetase [Waddlia chondrophila WSU 86-1044]CCB92164.1 Arginyl-tRNA synthetase [Waddlia chondrophila 2032/99]